MQDRGRSRRHGRTDERTSVESRYDPIDLISDPSDRCRHPGFWDLDDKRLEFAVRWGTSAIALPGAGDSNEGASGALEER